MDKKEVTILILIDGFLQFRFNCFTNYNWWVTILILIDGFLQYKVIKMFNVKKEESQSLF